MRQQEIIPTDYRLLPLEPLQPGRIQLHASATESKALFTFEALKPGLFRTTFSSPDHPLPPAPSAKRPVAVLDELHAAQSDGDSKSYSLGFGPLRADVNWSSGPPIVTLGYEGEDPLHTDLPLRSYVLDGPGASHYSRHYRGSLYVGLGEKAAPLNLSNRHFTLSATDSFGYDVHRSDPLYKHIPLLIRATPNGVVGVLSTSHGRGYCSVGSEMDGMWGFFNVYRQDHGGLEQYILVARTLPDLVTLYAELVGYPLLVPRWAFGYLAGGMKYSMLDEPRASDALLEFAQKLDLHDFPCSGFQMSSGYTMAESEPRTRNVFTWNRHRFPNPQEFCEAFHRRGIRLIANIKPYILASHPEYRKLAEKGGLFTDPRTGETGIARLWSAGGGESGEGGHIDFSSRAGYEFWFNGVKELRKIGMNCMWNDNNEYVVAFDDWQLALNHHAVADATKSCESAAIVGDALGRRDLGLWGRALHTELMGRASYDALLDTFPDERPFVLTRSASPGTMRYACSSWSGDNITSWSSMRGANALSLNAGICLMQNYGHDIGGFEGPQPSAELLLRWVQLGVHSPRFAINCFKTGTDNMVGDVIEPWMYPSIIPEVRRALRRRYELIPYLYNLMLLSHMKAIPPQKWIGWGYESDAAVWSNETLKNGEEQYWLGSSLVIGGVYAAGVESAWMYLPRKSLSDPGFLNTNAPYQYLAAGSWHQITSAWKESIPIIARIGGVVPIGKDGQTAAPGDRLNVANLPLDDWRGVEIFPPPMHQPSDEWYTETWLEDDGISPPPARVARLTVAYLTTTTAIHVRFESDTHQFEPQWTCNGLTLILPMGETRTITVDNASLIAKGIEKDGRGRTRTEIRVKSPVTAI